MADDEQQTGPDPDMDARDEREDRDDNPYELDQQAVARIIFAVDNGDRDLLIEELDPLHAADRVTMLADRPLQGQHRFREGLRGARHQEIARAAKRAMAVLQLNIASQTAESLQTSSSTLRLAEAQCHDDAVQNLQ